MLLAPPALSIIYINFNSRWVFDFVVVHVCTKRDGNFLAGWEIKLCDIFDKLRSYHRGAIKSFSESYCWVSSWLSVSFNNVYEMLNLHRLGPFWRIHGGVLILVKLQAEAGNEWQSSKIVHIFFSKEHCSRLLRLRDLFSFHPFLHLLCLILELFEVEANALWKVSNMNSNPDYRFSWDILSVWTN